MVGLSSSLMNMSVVGGFSVIAALLGRGACGGLMDVKGCWAVGWVRWGGMFLSGCFGAPCTPWGCAQLVWLVGVSGGFVYLPVVSGALAVGGVKNAGLRAKPEVPGNMVAVLLKWRLLPVRELGADTRHIGRSLPDSEPSSSD